MSNLAISAILTGTPMSRTMASPGRPIALACSTSWQASVIVMKYLVASGWVTVTGPAPAIWASNVGITEPLDPRTLPNRTLT